MAVLETRIANGETLTAEESLKRAHLTEDIGHKPDEALALFRTAYARYPENTQACFALGARLLAREEGEGIALLERTMALDADAAAACCELLRDYHWRNGRKEEAYRWHERLDDCQKLDAIEYLSRNQVLLTDTLEPHGLPAETIAAIRRQLTENTRIRRAYLVRKKVSRHTERPCFVFGFSVTPPFSLYRSSRIEKAMKQLQASVCLPEGTIIIPVENANARFAAKLKRVQDSRVL